VQTDSPLTDFLRYHVLIEVFDGDVDGWLTALEDCPDAPWCERDREFLLWLKMRLREDSALIPRIRSSVGASIEALEELPRRMYA
jgi:hypothetical protein